MNRAELMRIAKPILFNTEMVRAILDGRKTVTRRLVKKRQLIGLLADNCKNGTPEEFLKKKKYMFKPYCDMTDAELISTSYKPPYQLGDILYVRETFVQPAAHIYWYKADENSWLDSKNMRWKPSIHMPKEAARIFLKVTDVRVERLQDMDKMDAVNEGIDQRLCVNLKHALTKFKIVWNSTIRKSDIDRYGWDANPYVWVIGIERIEVTQ